MAIRAVLARRSRYDRETIVLETIVLPIKLPARMVSQAGVDPATPGGNGFTVRRSCRFATDPYYVHILLANSVYLIGASVRWKHLYLRSCTEVPPTTNYVTFIVPQLHQMPFTSDSSYMARQKGFEPLHGFYRLAVQQTVLFNHLSTTAY